ncbi:MAG TPA: hypothetical protein VIY73_21840, partial [Polyangiaceae bacterium]
MGRRSLVSLLAIAPAMLLTSGSAAAQSITDFDRTADEAALASVEVHPFTSLCTSNPNARFHCFAKLRADENGNVQQYASPQGYGPKDLESAYKLPTTGGTGKTVAVIDAYHYANAESDLAAYRSAMGLPACTSASGCFKQVAADGSTNFGGADPGGCQQGWTGEAALDLQMASAACPDCNVLIVEEPDDSTGFDQAVNTAVALGAVAVSNSYGGQEYSQESQEETTYTHAGVLITASTGDSGFGASYPATSAGVVAVGGTTLQTSSSSRGWAEAAWSSGGSGCSGVIAKPS